MAVGAVAYFVLTNRSSADTTSKTTGIIFQIETNIQELEDTVVAFKFTAFYKGFVKEQEGQYTLNNDTAGGRIGDENVHIIEFDETEPMQALKVEIFDDTYAFDLQSGASSIVPMFTKSSFYGLSWPMADSVAVKFDTSQYPYDTETDSRQITLGELYVTNSTNSYEWTAQGAVVTVNSVNKPFTINGIRVELKGPNYSDYYITTPLNLTSNYIFSSVTEPGTYTVSVSEGQCINKKKMSGFSQDISITEQDIKIGKSIPINVLVQIGSC